MKKLQLKKRIVSNLSEITNMNSVKGGGICFSCGEEFLPGHQLHKCQPPIQLDSVKPYCNTIEQCGRP